MSRYPSPSRTLLAGAEAVHLVVCCWVINIIIDHCQVVAITAAAAAAIVTVQFLSSNHAIVITIATVIIIVVIAVLPLGPNPAVVSLCRIVVVSSCCCHRCCHHCFLAHRELMIIAVVFAFLGGRIPIMPLLLLSCDEGCRWVLCTNADFGEVVDILKNYWLEGVLFFKYVHCFARGSVLEY